MPFSNYLRFSLVALLFGFFSTVYAQEVKRSSGISVKCGDIIEGEFTSNYQEDIYRIDVKSGDTINVSLSPLGVGLKSLIYVTGPTNLGVVGSKGVRVWSEYLDVTDSDAQPTINSGVLSAKGTYSIRVSNFSFGSYNYKNDSYAALYDSLGIGTYTLYIACTLRDGTVINPDDKTSATTGDTSDMATTTTAPTVCPSLGFCGLGPIDFSTTNFPKLLVNTPFGGDISADNNQILGFKFDASANDVIALNITRSGNLNLGLIVLSADNKVVFQASLVTSSELSTKFTLPTTGTYTIGIFRIDLLPPDAPEATAFQLTATLNP